MYLGYVGLFQLDVITNDSFFEMYFLGLSVMNHAV